MSPKSLASYALVSLACLATIWYLRTESMNKTYTMSSADLEDPTPPADDSANISAFEVHVNLTKTEDDYQQVYNSTLRRYIDLPSQQTDEDNFSITAILPVTQSSMSAMLSTLSTILQNPRKVSDIVLLCPLEIQGTVRHALRHFLYSSEFVVYVDIDISVWHTDVEVGAAILYVARQLTTRALLVLDTDGLAELRERNVAFLLSPPTLSTPLGPRASDVSGADFVCFGAQRQDTAGFLVPPFVLPSDSIPGQNITTDDRLGFWGVFGKHLSAEMGFSGVVYGLVEAGAYTCSSEHRHHPRFGSSSPLYDTTLHPDEDPLIKVGGSAHYAITDNPGTFIFIFPSVKNLRLLYPVICRLQEEGHHAFSLISPEGKDVMNPLDTEVHSDVFTHLEDCDIDITVLPEGDTLDDMASSLWDWIISLSSLPDILVVPDQRHTTLDAMDIMRGWHPDFDATVVRIPLADLPFCDWMGSLGLDEWLNWHVPQVDITIITDSRPASLTRLLKSLSSAHLFGDKIDIRVNMEQTADPETKRVVQAFEWKHGTVLANRRVIHGGLLPAVVESWYPRSDDSYGLILEDDVEVSPLFYGWVKMSLLKYRYGRKADRSKQLFGISLYQQKNLELRPEGSRHRFAPRTTFSSVPNTHLNTPYLSQIPCSWGAIYFPEHWREFHDYLSTRLSGSYRALSADAVVAPGVRSNKWTRSWKKYFIEMAYLRGYVMLYPNFRDYISLSTNHLEVGSHVKDMPAEVYAQKRKLFLHPLMQRPQVTPGVPTSTGLLDLPDHEMPTWDKLPVLDLLGLMADEQTLVERGRKRSEELFGCQVEVDGKFDVKAWLCLVDGT